MSEFMTAAEMAELAEMDAAFEERDIEVITEEINFYKRQAGSAILEIGKRLVEAKAQLSHGEWLPWLEEKVAFSERSAQQYMRLWREDGKSAAVADLGVRKALVLLALPESEREEFAAENHAADMTAKELEEAVRQRKIAELKAGIEETAKLMQDKEDLDADAAGERRNEIVQKRSTLESELRDLHHRTETNREVLRQIEKQSAAIADVEKRLMTIGSLADTANGNLSGREKIMLETYVQMAYFDRIIERANTRFMVMSGGQYELKRRREADNNRSQSGLSLDVVDHYNGTERSVKTLSGGESFKASLSLALGLSDEIQASAGGIQLDTMFVDEGFGSLDEESLQQAMRALSGLAEGNRLVGIISHVPELREKIDRQIIVRKDRSGGSRVEVVK